jgi:hydrogenase maturation protein HypF
MSNLLTTATERETEAETQCLPTDVVAVKYLLQGRVQGIGVRPAIARAAIRLHLNGSVCNTTDGVRVILEGLDSNIARIEETLREELSSQAVLHFVSMVELPVVGFTDFRILEDLANLQAVVADVPTDLAMCWDCAAELVDPTNRRFGYGFSSCTQCGPRYSIVRSMPWERSRSTMACFDYCEACAAEFRKLDERRFHAQTITCPDCGPQLWFESEIASSHCRGGDAFESAIRLLRSGGVLALKGLGGYQLICDARNPEAVKRLRLRKRRETKPLAVMISERELAEAMALPWDISDVSKDGVPAFARANLSHPTVVDLEAVCDSAERSERCGNALWEHHQQEFQALTSRVNPIVLVCTGELLMFQSLSLAPQVSSGFSTIGLMLPTTPLHAMLLKALQTPLVVTSGNEDSEPIVYEENAARRALDGIADGWLHHDRRIERPIDDSVVRIIAGQSVTIRAGRGIAPLRLPLQTSHRILAVGGEQKVACAFSNGHQTVLGPHLGNMSSLAMRQRFIEHIESLQQLYQATPDTIVHDLHPDYFTSRWAADRGLRTIAVQHHHAHIVSCMLKHQIHDSEVLGVAFDGTGFGTDGTIWGGEVLLATKTSFRRVGRVLPFVLPGGEKAIDEPWRTAVSLLTTAMPEITDEEIAHLLHKTQEHHRCATQADQRFGMFAADVSLAKIRQVQQLVTSANGPLTSSMGRLFDGMAAIILGLCKSSFEGEPAMRLESVCAESAGPESNSGESTSSQWPARMKGMLDERDGMLCFDWRALVREIVTDLRLGRSSAAISRSFHQAIADMVTSVVERFGGYKVVLSGGCFQNRILTETIVGQLKLKSREVLTHGKIPTNDGGLAAGQIAIAAALLDLEHEQESCRCA